MESHVLARAAGEGTATQHVAAEPPTGVVGWDLETARDRQDSLRSSTPPAPNSGSGENLRKSGRVS